MGSRSQPHEIDKDFTVKAIIFVIIESSNSKHLEELNLKWDHQEEEMMGKLGILC